MRGFDIADIGDARIGFLALQRKDGRGHAPARRHKLTALGLIADNWGCVVGEDAIKRWQIARPVVHGTGEFADCPLAFRHRIEIAQKSVLLIALSPHAAHAGVDIDAHSFARGRAPGSGATIGHAVRSKRQSSPLGSQ